MLSVLIVHPERDRREDLAGRLREAGYAVAQAETPGELAPNIRVDAWIPHAGLSVQSRQEVLGRIGRAKEVVDKGEDGPILNALAVLATETRPLVQLGVGALDLRGQRVLRDGAPVALTGRESALLAWLISRPGQVVSRGELLEKVWGYRPDMVTRTVDVTVARLREKIERDTGKPEHLLTVRGEGYRLVIPEAEEEAPATDLLGRDGDLARLRRALGPGRALTLLGPGGVGKTALARALCRERPALFVELEGVAQGVRTALARALELPQPGHADPETLGQALSHRGLTLVVLDNAEHLVEETRELVEALGEAAPELCVVSTSRVPLQAAVELVFRVRPLETSAAQTLFLTRVRRRNPDWRVAPAVLVEITEQLDGLPLALELAAGRAALLSGPDLLKRIQASTAWLGGSERTLQRAVALSWELLTPSAQEVLLALCVFRGGARLAMLERMLERPIGEVADEVEQLLDHGLIRQEGERLWPFVGVVERAGQEALEALRRAHAGAFAAWSRSPEADPFGPAGWEAVARLQVERENLLLALEHADAVGDLALALLHEWETRDAPAHEVRRLATALERVEDATQRARGLQAYVFSRLFFGGYAEAVSYRPELETLLPQLAPKDQAGVVFTLGNLARLGYEDSEVTLMEQACALAPESPVAMRALLYLSSMHQAPERRDACMRQAEAIGDRLGSAPLLATLRCANASRLFQQGRYERCLAVSRQGMEHREELPPALLGALESEAGKALVALGRFAESQEVLDRCLARYRQWGASRFVGGTQLNRSAALLGLGQLDEALDAALEASRMARRSGSVRGQLRSHCAMARIWMAKGEHSELQTELNAARALLTQDPSARGELEALEAQAAQALGGEPAPV